MLAFLKDLFRPIRRTDEDFGEMRYLRQTATWECTAHFAPLNRPLEVLLFGTEDGPTHRQRELWRGLAAGYAGLESLARPVVEKLAQESGEPDFSCELAAVTLPGDAEGDYDIELTFGEVAGPPQIDVRFSAGRVVDVSGPM